MNQQRVLIADSSEDFCNALQDILRRICTVRSCSSGRKALQLLSELQPDVLVLDLMLPELDGLSVLKALSATGSRPVILATTCFVSDYIIASAQSLKVDYLLVKPCDVHATAARIQEQLADLDSSRQNLSDLRFRISGLLLMMGFSVKLNGFRYLREAILQMLEKPDQSITKELYPEVARNLGSVDSHVERSIRAAIEDAWKRRDQRIWQLYFASDSQGTPKKPTNAVFISRIADGIRISSGLPSSEPLIFVPSEGAASPGLARCEER